MSFENVVLVYERYLYILHHISSLTAKSTHNIFKNEFLGYYVLY